MKINPHKTVSASEEGIIISYRESNKHQFLSYQERSQMSHKPKYQRFSKPVLNRVQQQLYAQTVYGPTYYTEKELREMSKAKLQKITEDYNKVQNVLNQWKQEIVHEKVDKFLLALFPKSKLVKTLTTYRTYDDKLVFRQSFKELGLDQIQIVNKLITAKLLPENFYSLGIQPA
jgi:hypothetical protein